MVEFDFDLASDTAMSVASEMVEEMSLSHSDAERIALAIKNEIWNLTHKVQQGAEHTSTGSASDDEAAGKKGPPSEGSAKPEVGAGLRSPRPSVTGRAAVLTHRGAPPCVPAEQGLTLRSAPRRRRRARSAGRAATASCPCTPLTGTHDLRRSSRPSTWSPHSPGQRAMRALLALQ